MSDYLNPLKSVNHQIVLRNVKVKKIEVISPYFTKVTLHGSDLKNFVSMSPDDHIKAFFADPKAPHLTLPTLGEKGIQWPEGQIPAVMRDFTPLKYDVEKQTLELIFYKHKTGPAMNWLNKAEVGSDFHFAGPRGSAVLSYVFDWYLFITDEAGLPSLTRRLQEFPEGSHCQIFAEVESLEHELKLNLPVNCKVAWLHRNKQIQPGTSELVLRALREFEWPQGKFFSWVKTESLAAIEIKNFLIKNKNVNPNWIKASGYWKR